MAIHDFKSQRLFLDGDLIAGRAIEVPVSRPITC